MSRKWCLWLLGLVLLAWTSGCVTAGEGEKMRQDIDALKAEQRTSLASFKKKEAELAKTVAQAKADVAELKRVLKEATELLQRSSANVGADVEELRREIEMLRGRTEEAAFRLDKLENDLKIYKEDIELRFSGAAKENLPQDASGLLRYAIGKVDAKDYGSSRRALEAFVSRFPKDRRVDAVTYLLGETYFLEKQYVSAIFEYQKILKNYPKSSKLPDAKFRIGESFVAIRKCKQARAFFESVVKDHKRSRRAKKARKFLKRMRDGACPR